VLKVPACRLPAGRQGRQVEMTFKNLPASDFKAFGTIIITHTIRFGKTGLPADRYELTQCFLTINFGHDPARIHEFESFISR